MTLYTNNHYQAHFQSIRELYLKIEILNSTDQVIDRIDGLGISGSININANSPIRRSCDLTLTLTTPLLPSPTSPIWLNRRFRLWIGIRSSLSGEILYFNQGIYIIDNPSVNISISDRTISIRGLDKMALLTGDVAGQLATGLRVLVNTPIHQAIRSTAQLGGETRFLIENSPFNTPYTIDTSAGSHFWDTISELTNLFMDWQCFYDVAGFLNFNATRIKNTDSIIWNFGDRDVRIRCNNEINFANIKNHFKIYGRVLANGVQVRAEREVRNANSTSPFTIEKIGRRSFVETETNYFTNEQCQQRVNYEERMRTNLNERINVTCLPIYMIDVNNLVRFNSIEDNVVGVYCVDEITLPIKYDGNMQFSAYKVY